MVILSRDVMALNWSLSFIGRRWMLWRATTGYGEPSFAWVMCNSTLPGQQLIRSYPLFFGRHEAIVEVEEGDFLSNECFNW